MKDLLGREILIGDTVAYPGRYGSHLWVSIAKVIGFGERKEVWSDRKKPILKVQIKDSSDQWEGKNSGRKTFVERIDRVVIIDVSKQKEAV